MGSFSSAPPVLFYTWTCTPWSSSYPKESRLIHPFPLIPSCSPNSYGLLPGLLPLDRSIPTPAARLIYPGVLAGKTCPFNPTPPPPLNGIFSSAETMVTPRKFRSEPSSSIASVVRKVHHAIVSGIVEACQRECASIIRKIGAKSRSSNDIASVVNATRMAGVAASDGREVVSGFFGG